MNGTISFDFTKRVGKIKPMHGVGQPPFDSPKKDYFHYLKEANIPYSRLHDVGGAYGGFIYVDIPNIFRDFDADENDPASYDFVFTDNLIKRLIDNGCEPIYRLGVTIENYADMRAYRIYPPKDFKKWARICEHIIRHYNEGWADGHHFGIKFWEIWNEPEGSDTAGTNNGRYSQMWLGTKEQYFDLYDTAARHLKSVFGDSIMVGGYASCGFFSDRVYDKDGKVLREDYVPHYAPWKYYEDYFDWFFGKLKENGTPIDFFSWHCYGDPEEFITDYNSFRRHIEKAGFPELCNMLNEWNTDHYPHRRGTSRASADAAAVMCIMQDRKVDLMCFYDARMGASIYGGLFDPLKKTPYCTYYSFKAFGELYKLGTQTRCELTDLEHVYACCATDGRKNGVLIANINAEKVDLETNLEGRWKAYLIDENHFMTEIPFDAKNVTLGGYGTLFLENE